MGNALKNAVRIGNDLDSFLNEHPQVTVDYDNSGNAIDVHFSEDCTSKTYSISNGKLVFLEFATPTSHSRYEECS